MTIQISGNFVTCMVIAVTIILHILIISLPWEDLIMLLNFKFEGYFR